MKTTPRNVLSYILRNPKGCEGFVPENECEPTDVQPGRDKLDVLAERVMSGEPLWHDDDVDCFDNRG